MTKKTRDHSNLPILAVGVEEAAIILGVGQDRIRALVADGTIGTVPHLSSPRKHVIAVAELERLASAGITRPTDRQR